MSTNEERLTTHYWFRPCTALLLLLLLLSLSPAFGGMVVPSTDRLALGDWSYDALAKLAANGLVPGYSARVFEGERLFDRMDMAGILDSIIESAPGKAPGPADATLIGKLILEFRPELLEVNPAAIDNWKALSSSSEKKTAFLMGQLLGVAGGPRDIESNASLSGFLNLSPTTFSVATYSERRPQFFRNDTTDAIPDKFFLQGFAGNTQWSVGSEYLNWGPSYAGGLILSDNSGAFLQGRVATEFDLGWFGGKFKLTEFASPFSEDGTQLYFFGRRIEKNLSKRWHLGLSETAKTNEVPNPAILVIPFYLYQKLFITNDEPSHFKYNGFVDLTYRRDSGNEFYGEWLVDDISAPKLLFPDRFRIPRQTGLTLGFYMPKALSGDRPTSFRAEYTYIDPRTYLATTPTTSPELDYLHDGDVIGYPPGPNTQTIYLRSERYLTGKLSFIAEYLNQTPKTNALPVPLEKNFVSLKAAYDIAPNTSVSFRIAPYDIAQPGMAKSDGILYETEAWYSF